MEPLANAARLGSPDALRAARGRARLVIAALLALAVPPALALDGSRTLTQALHRTWQVPQGLPEATIHAIVQAGDGYLWLGTQTGLVRFDGVRFTKLTGRGGVELGDPWVRDLCEDREHRLWVATGEDDLLRIDADLVTRYGRSAGLPQGGVARLLLDRRGSLWACTPGGLAHLEGDRFRAFGSADGLAAENLRAVCEANDGTFWVGGDGPRIAAFDGARFAPPLLLTSVPGYASVLALLAARDGVLWIGTTCGLVRLAAGEERCVTITDGLSGDAVFCLDEGSDGTLWAGTNDGFSRLRAGEIDVFRASDGLSQSSVHALCEDREGSLWVGTKHGLNQFLDRRTIPFTAREGLASNDTGPVLQDRAGTIWVGTRDAGLSRFDGHRFTSVSTALGLVSNAVQGLACDRDGELWVATDHGLNRLHDGRVTATLTAASGLPAESVKCLLVDRGGDLWAGTTAGLAVLRGDRFVVPAGLEMAAPIVALAEHDGTIVLAARTRSGLFAWDGRTLRELAQDGISLRDADCFFPDGDRLLIGSRGGGLLVLDGGGRIAAVTTRDGLFDDDLVGIAADDRGRLWMACSKGIFSIERTELTRFLLGAVAGITSMPFSPTEALRTIECQPDVQPAAFRMRDGQLWFATIRGVIVVDPLHLDVKLPPMPVVIEDVIVDGASERPDRIATLPPGRHNLEFRYAGLSFRSPGRLTFRQLLENFDADWRDDDTRREAFYTNLPPGPYRFRVEAQNVDGTRIEAPQPVAFEIAPQLYQRPWFVAAVIAALGLLVWLAHRVRLRAVRRQLDAVVGERVRIARELHDTLLQGLSGVTMQLQALAARLTSGGERDALEGIIRDAGDCMRDARRSVAGLRQEQDVPDGLGAALARAAQPLAGRCEVRLDLDPVDGVLRPEAEYHLQRIAQEALSNCVRHARAHTVELALRRQPGQVRLSVRDDGAGFSPEDARRRSTGRFGLLGMQERARLLGSELEIDSAPGRGTTVSVVVRLPSRDGALRGAQVQNGRKEDPS